MRFQKNNIKDKKIIVKFARKNRWYIRLDNGLSTITMPYANYVWLLNNPGFEETPIGYAVHHLDNDSFNDDVSNLALMYKHHHTAYHLKHIQAPKTKIELDTNGHGVPLRKPTVIYRKCRGIWLIHYQKRQNGHTVNKAIYNIDGPGKNFKTKEDAERAINYIWPTKPWRYS